jgi:hypothetical protein
MLAGLENSEFGLAHAGELLAAAGAERAHGAGATAGNPVVGEPMGRRGAAERARRR